MSEISVSGSVSGCVCPDSDSDSDMSKLFKNRLSAAQCSTSYILGLFVYNN